MEAKREPLPKGMAHVEYVALKPQIDEMLMKGYNIKMAYNALKEKGLVTMTYAAMYENVTRAGRKAMKAQRTPREEDTRA